VNISSSQSKSVDLGPSDTGAVTVGIDDYDLVFDGDAGETKVQPGFEIKTKTWTDAQFRKLASYVRI